MNTSSTPPVRPGLAAIDWTALHQRLEAVRRALERDGAPSAQAQRAILKARAAAIARAPETDRPAQAGLEAVVFRLAHETYGVESGYVREIVPMRDFTPVPCAPPFVYGLINVRGQIVSVIHLNTFFNLPEKGLTDLNKIIILRDARMEFGILADAVTGVQTVPQSAIQTPASTLTGIRNAYLRGVTAGGLILLDAEALLSGPRLVVHETVDAV